MITIANGNWIADLGAMTCTDYVNKIVVKMEREGRAIRGKLEDIPMELFAEWAKEPDGEKYVIKGIIPQGIIPFDNRCRLGHVQTTFARDTRLLGY